MDQIDLCLENHVVHRPGDASVERLGERHPRHGWGHEFLENGVVTRGMKKGTHIAFDLFDKPVFIGGALARHHHRVQRLQS